MDNKRIFSLCVMCGFFSVFLHAEGAAFSRTWNRDALLDEAVKNNSAYQKAQSQSREARSVYLEARAARLPVLRFVSNLSYQTSPPSVTIESGALYPGGNIPLTVNTPSPYPGINLPPSTADFPFPPLPREDVTLSLFDKTRYEFGLTLEQPVFTWGRIHYSVEAASLGSEAALVKQEQELRDLRTAVDSHLYSLSFLREMQELLGEQKVRAGRLVELSEDNYASGFLLHTDLLAARLFSKELAMGEFAVEESRDTSFLALQTLTGLAGLNPAAVEIPDAAKRTNSPYSRSGKAELLSRLLEKNLSLRMLRLQTRACEKRVAAYKSRSYGKPELGLFFQLTYGGPLFPFVQSGWRDDNTLNFQAALGIRSLLIDGGSMYYGIRQREEMLTQARLEEEKGRREFEEYLERSLLQLEVSLHRQEYLSLKAETDMAKKEQAENARQTGYGEEREVLTHELNWYTSQIDLLREKMNALLLVLRLENVLGD